MITQEVFYIQEDQITSTDHFNELSERLSLLDVTDVLE